MIIIRRSQSTHRRATSTPARESLAVRRALSTIKARAKSSMTKASRWSQVQVLGTKRLCWRARLRIDWTWRAVVTFRTVWSLQIRRIRSHRQITRDMAAKSQWAHSTWLNSQRETLMMRICQESRTGQVHHRGCFNWGKSCIHACLSPEQARRMWEILRLWGQMRRHR